MKQRIGFCFRRLGAFALDLFIIVILGAAFYPIRYLTSFGDSPLYLLKVPGWPLALLAFAYFCAFDFWGISPGKKWLGLRILRADGAPISLAQSALRAALVIFALELWAVNLFQIPFTGEVFFLYRALVKAIFCGSIFTPFFDAQARTPVDFITQTRVVGAKFSPAFKRSVVPWVLAALLVPLVFMLRPVNAWKSAPRGTQFDIAEQFDGEMRVRVLLNPMDFGAWNSAEAAKASTEKMYAAMRELNKLLLLSLLAEGEELPNGLALGFYQPKFVGLIPYQDKMGGRDYPPEELKAAREELRALREKK